MVAVAQPDARPQDSGPDFTQIARMPDGRFLPGRSANPAGKPHGTVGLARAIADQTGGGLKMVSRMVEMVDSTNEAMAAQACTWLANRLWGKPKETVEIEQVRKQLILVMHSSSDLAQLDTPPHPYDNTTAQPHK